MCPSCERDVNKSSINRVIASQFVAVQGIAREFRAFDRARICDSIHPSKAAADDASRKQRPRYTEQLMFGALQSVDAGVACRPSRPGSYRPVKNVTWPITVRVFARTQAVQASRKTR
ncbi:unnamed protein product [Phaeothamnion confervicola]